ADPHADADGDGSDDECAAVGRGSRCDAVLRWCTLPYRDRETASIPWYLAAPSPELFEAVQTAVVEWDVALRSAVIAGRHAECARTAEVGCAESYPTPVSQQHDDADAVALVTEVEACRNGRAYADRLGDRARCDALADELGATRGYGAYAVQLAK